MNFLNTLISGASNLVFNLQQRDHSGVSYLFQQNNPQQLPLSPSEDFNSRKGSNNNKIILSDLLLSNSCSTSKAPHIPPNNFEQNEGNKQIDASMQQSYFDPNTATSADVGIQFKPDTNGSFINTNTHNNINNKNLVLPNIQIEDQMQQSYLLSQLIIAQQKNLIGQLLYASQPQNQPIQNTGFRTPQPIIPAVAGQTQENRILVENLSSDKMESNLGRINKQEQIEDSPEIACPSLKKSLKKPQKKVNNCGHHDKEHYAKGMCSNCYHKYGRTKKPWLCPHTKLYACGLCQNCYINKYNQRKRVEGSEQIEGNFDEKNMESCREMKNVSQAEMLKYSNDKLQKTLLIQYAVAAADGDDEQEEGEEKHQEINE